MHPMTKERTTSQQTSAGRAAAQVVVATPETPAGDKASRRGFHATSFTLKLAAIICMTCNHAVWILGPAIPLGLRYVLYAVGGATFPIMAFMLVEGFRHTSNLKRYAWRLLLWAVIAEVPFYLFLSEPESLYLGNVLFTLFMGLALLWTHRNSRSPAFWAMLVMVLGLSSLCDWGVIGPIIILTYYLTNAGPGPEGRRGILLTMLLPLLSNIANGVASGAEYLQAGYAFSTAVSAAMPSVLYGVVGVAIATALLLSYDGQLGRALAKGSSANRFNIHTLIKWGFYAYYPLHILVLGLIGTALGTI